jgi:hypothetical protein
LEFCVSQTVQRNTWQQSGPREAACNRIGLSVVNMVMGDGAMTAAEPQGAPTEIEAVYRDRYVALVRHARLVVGSQAVAEELVQEAFIRLHRAWDRADEPRAYVHVIVINLCRTWCARARSSTAMAT